MAHGARDSALLDSGVLCGIARAVAAVMWQEPACVSVRDNSSRTCGAQRGRWRAFVTGFWFMRRLITLTVYITMVALGVSFVLGFLLHGGRGILFAMGAFLACFGTYLVWTDFFRRLE
jgi:hypothetical protein